MLGKGKSDLYCVMVVIDRFVGRLPTSYGGVEMPSEAVFVIIMRKHRKTT